MLFTTTTQYVALAVALVAGWLFGLASHPGGKRWKQRYAEERDAHAATRRDYDARLTDTGRGHDAQLTEAKARISELERENARLAKASPVTAATIAPNGHAPATAARPAYPAGSDRGWFNWNNRVSPTR
jgi:hypothetical protein